MWSPCRKDDERCNEADSNDNDWRAAKPRRGNHYCYRRWSSGVVGERGDSGLDVMGERRTIGKRAKGGVDVRGWSYAVDARISGN